MTKVIFQNNRLASSLIFKRELLFVTDTLAPTKHKNCSLKDKSNNIMERGGIHGRIEDAKE
jgi:hypothetical protein